MAAKGNIAHEHRMHDASDSESTDPDSPMSIEGSTSDQELSEDNQTHERTEATFAYIDTSVNLTPEEREKWRRSGHKPGTYICPECGKGLSRIDSLTRHRRSRHRVGRQYFCRHPGCRRQTWGFGRFDNYRRHMESSHGIFIEPNDTKERGISARECTIHETEQLQRQEREEAAVKAKATKSRTKTPLPTAHLPDAQSYDIPEQVNFIRPIPPERRSNHNNSNITNVPTARDLDSRRNLAKSMAKSHHARASQQLPVKKESASLLLNTLRPVEEEDLRSLEPEELVRRLRAKTRECEELQQRNRVLTMERDEYVEALKMSEELRGV